ncbi:MAG: hypothetical protein KGQ37_03205 [Hyphomicrobiales bacterium]|nr:hypothetical protein [Hyphomicrobiales bacterium]
MISLPVPVTGSTDGQKRYLRGVASDRRRHEWDGGGFFLQYRCLVNAFRAQIVVLSLEGILLTMAHYGQDEGCRTHIVIM